MFKCKTNYKAFDKRDEAVDNLELSRVKADSKKSVKRIADNLTGEKAKFYLILDYFLDAKEKPEGHFLCFGESKVMEKQFTTVEGKAGKENKRMSENPKKACFGYAYVTGTGAKKRIVFQPEDTKIPTGRWGKILKDLKSFLAGIKPALQLGDAVDDNPTNEEDAKEKIEDLKKQDALEETAIFEEMAGEKSGKKVFGKTTFSQIKTAMKALKAEKDKDKRNLIMDNLIKLSQKWLDKHGSSKDKKDVEKRKTLEKLVANLKKQKDFSEGDTLMLFYKKILRDKEAFDNLEETDKNASESLRKGNQILVDINHWKTLFNRERTPEKEHENMHRNMANFITSVTAKNENFKDLVNSQQIIREYHQIELKNNELVKTVIPNALTEYEKLLAITNLERRISKLESQLS